MTEKIEPMTAAEWRAEDFSGGIAVRYPRVLAALEEREALLGEREAAIGTTAMGAVLECEADSVKRGEKFNVEARVNVLRAAARRVRELEGECEKWKQDARVPTAHARVGALVAAIREHPEAHRGHYVTLLTKNGAWTTAWTEKALAETLSHLDSLLPKEPEVAPSGYTYTLATNFDNPVVFQRRTYAGGRTEDFIANEAHTPPCDREFVAALLGGRNGK